MATKDYSLKKGGDKRESSFNLNNGAKNDLSTLVVKSQSEMTKKSNSFGGNDVCTRSKKDSHSWNKSTLDLGRFGSTDSQEKKLRSGSTGNGMDLWEEEYARNDTLISKTSNQRTSMSSLYSETAKVELWTLAKNEYHILQLISSISPLHGTLEYNMEFSSKFDGVEFYKFLPKVQYYTIKTTSNQIVKVIASVEAVGNSNIPSMIREGDVIMGLEFKKQKQTVDVAIEADPITTFLKGNGHLNVWRASHTETYEMLIEHCKRNSYESKSASSGEQKSTPAMPSGSQSSIPPALIPVPQMITSEKIPHPPPAPSQNPQPLPMNQAAEATAGPSTAQYPDQAQATETPKKSLFARGINQLRKLPGRLSCKPRRRRPSPEQ